ARGDLQRLPARRPGGVEGGAAAAQPVAAGPDALHAAGRGQGGAGPARPADRAVPVARVGAGAGPGAEDARGPGGGGAAAAGGGGSFRISTGGSIGLSSVATR